MLALPFSRAERSEEHTSELQSHVNLVCRLLLEKINKQILLDSAFSDHLLFLISLRPPCPTLCPYTTLFRSYDRSQRRLREAEHGRIASCRLRIDNAGLPRAPFLLTESTDCPCSHCLSRAPRDRKSTRLNSSHMSISYAVFCLKK